MKKYIILISLTIASLSNLIAQVGISGSLKKADPSAMLDIESTSSGFLMPSMTEAERSAIGAPATGLLVHQKDGKQGFYANTGTPNTKKWIQFRTTTNEYEKRIPISKTNFIITTPGSYYLTKNLIGGYRGITVKCDNVSIDLNGFALVGGNNSRDGIRIYSRLKNITIKNGIILNWSADGIFGPGADNLIVKNILAYNNGSYGGISIGDNAIVINCHVKNNDNVGISPGDASIVENCVSTDNNSDGIRVSDGSIVNKSIASNNSSDGINIDNGCFVSQSISHGNISDGINAAYLGSLVIENHTYSNADNGIRMSNGFAIQNVTNNNGTCVSAGTCNIQSNIYYKGAGIYARNRSFVIWNRSSNNYFGISSYGCAMIQNDLSNNYHVGLLLFASSSSYPSFYLNNTASKNGLQPLSNSSFTAGDFFNHGNLVAHGPIIDVTNVGNLINNTNTNFEWANFKY